MVLDFEYDIYLLLFLRKATFYLVVLDSLLVPVIFKTCCLNELALSYCYSVWRIDRPWFLVECFDVTAVGYGKQDEDIYCS